MTLPLLAIRSPRSTGFAFCDKLEEPSALTRLARRRAAKYKLSGAMGRLPDRGRDGEDGVDLPEDATGQMCSLNGGDGMIPCRELME